VIWSNDVVRKIDAIPLDRTEELSISEELLHQCAEQYVPTIQDPRLTRSYIS
jgi:hypothetical protein